MFSRRIAAAILATIVLCTACTRQAGNGGQGSCYDLGYRLARQDESDPGELNVQLAESASQHEQREALELSGCIASDTSPADVANEQLQLAAFYMSAAGHAVTAEDLDRARAMVSLGQSEMDKIDASKLDESSSTVLRLLRQDAQNDARGHWTKLL